jgi:flagellar hook-associated protein 3 FlgL
MLVERITSLMTSQQATADLASDFSNLSQTESELSSGKSINQPSDNPYGASVVLDLNSQMSALSSYAGNISDGTGWLNSASTALTNIQSMVARVRELVVEGSNGTNNTTADQSAATEVNQLIAEIKQSANAQYNGSYIFSGDSTTTAPYLTGATDTYQGNSGTVTREIGPGSSMQINTNISSILGDGSGSNDGLLLSTLRQISSDLNAGTPAAQTALGTTDLSALDGNLNTLEEAQSNVGALTNRLSIASASVQSTQSSDSTELANTQDANMAQLATTYSTQSAAYQAALQSGAQIIQESLLTFLNP